MELVLPGAVAQFQPAVLHRADAAHDIGEHGIALVSAVLTVLTPVGHIIGVMSQQDEIIAIPHVQAVDNRLIKLLPHLNLLQLGIPQGHEAAVFVAVRHLLGGEHDVDEVPAQRAGQGLFQQG